MRDCSTGNSSRQSGSNSFSELRTSDSVRSLIELTCAAPGLDDDFGGEKEKADLVDYDLLDLGGGNAGNGTVTSALLQSSLAKIVTIKPAILPRVRRRHGNAGGVKNDPFSSAGACARVAAARLRELFRKWAWTASHFFRSTMPACSPA